MEYITVYTTKDNHEVKILKDLFEEEQLDYKILENKAESGANSSEGSQKRFQVAEKDKAKATELIDQTGFPQSRDHAPVGRTGRMPGNKWILFFLAALILVLVALVIYWFMMVP